MATDESTAVNAGTVPVLVFIASLAAGGAVAQCYFEVVWYKYNVQCTMYSKLLVGSYL